MTKKLTIIDLEEAQTVMAAALQKANELAVPVFAIVVDSTGQTVTAARVDGSVYFAERIARGKAQTAIGMGTATEEWERLSESNPGFAGGITSVADFTPFSGGVPLHSDGHLVGAIGISGGSSAQDVEIAVAAAAAFS